MQLSYNEACTLKNSTLEEDMRLCEQVGFDYMELRLDTVRKYLETHPLQDLVNFFASSRVRPFALNGIYVHREFLRPEDQQRSMKLLDDIKFGCEICCAVGSDSVIMVPPLYMESENKHYEDSWQQIEEDNVRIFSTMSELLASYGLKIGIEIVGAPRCSIRTVQQCNIILDKVNAPNLGYTLDAFNLWLYNKDNSFQDVLETYPEKLFIVHVNGGEDGRLEDLRQSYRTFVNRGVMPVANYVKNLQKVGFNGPISIEFFNEEFYRWTAEEVIREAYASTRELLVQCNALH